MKILFLGLIFSTLAIADGTQVQSKKITTAFSHSDVIIHVLQSQSYKDLVAKDKRLSQSQIKSIDVDREGEVPNRVYKVKLNLQNIDGGVPYNCDVPGEVKIVVKKSGRPAIARSELGSPLFNEKDIDCNEKDIDCAE